MGRRRAQRESSGSPRHLPAGARQSRRGGSRSTSSERRSRSSEPLSQSAMLKKMESMMEAFSTAIVGEFQAGQNKLWDKLGHHEEPIINLSSRLDHTAE
eukprot:2303896-Pyramimonas_sp.AAC.1